MDFASLIEDLAREAAFLAMRVTPEVRLASLDDQRAPAQQSDNCRLKFHLRESNGSGIGAEHIDSAGAKVKAVGITVAAQRAASSIENRHGEREAAHEVKALLTRA